MVAELKADLVEQNRELIAQRQNWPPGALEAVRGLEGRYPGWSAWYTTGGLPADPQPGYRARQKGDGFNRPVLAAPRPQRLAALIEALDGLAGHPPPA